MKVTLPYGRSDLDVELPDNVDVFLPVSTPTLPDPDSAVRHALAHPLNSRPLRDLVRPTDSVAIVISDITRPVPNRTLIPPILETLAAAGVPRDRVVIVNGTGMHRANSRDELAIMLGEEVVDNYRIINHDARDRSTLVYLPANGRSAEVRVNRDYLEADLKILTGFIEPHIFAGYSGGGKAILPGICGAETILSNHSFAFLADPNATWCRADDNPLFQDIRKVALATRPSFIVNVTLNEKKVITGVFAGEMVAAHDAGIAQAARQALKPIPHLYDIAVTTNMGWPADLNLYQSMKGMSVAAQAVKKGGKIVIAAECAEAIGNDDFLAVLRSGPSYPALMEKIGAPGFAADEQWGVQCIGMVWERAEIHLYSAMSREVVEDEAHLHYCADVSATVAALAEEFRRANGGREPAICVLPYGQLTVPHLQS